MPKLTIDGREIEVASGTTVIQAAQHLGIDIPHFCWHPDLAVDGNCRMCVVEIEKQPKLQISCNTAAAEGLVVHTDTPRVRAARRSTLEFLLVNHPIDCPVCDQAGECYLQNQYQAYTLHDARTQLEEKVHKRKLVDLGPILLDAERCVLCSRCLRFESEVVGTSALMFANRGNRTEIATFQNRPITHGYAGNLADVCPVGALLSHDFRFKMRVWFLTSTPSICPGCSTGCNVYVDHRDDEIYRLRPRRNPDVNKSWLCDPGRATYKAVAAPERTKTALVRSGNGWSTLPLAEALDRLAGRIRGAGRQLAILGTPQATNEDLFALRVLADATGAQLDFRVGDPELKVHELEDGILLRADKNPNTQGALDLGIARSGVDEIVAACRKGEVQALLLQGPELLRLPAAGVFLERVPFIAVMTTHDEPALERAHLILPAAAWPEIDGTFTNHQRRVQRILRAVPAPGEARPRWELVVELLRRLGAPFAAASARELFAEVVRAVPEYVGLDYRALGESGRGAFPAGAHGGPPFPQE
jgi:NADH-quinone oxidoreductase subunit G